jgi:hypothetical protein
LDGTNGESEAKSRLHGCGVAEVGDVVERPLRLAEFDEFFRVLLKRRASDDTAATDGAGSGDLARKAKSSRATSLNARLGVARTSDSNSAHGRTVW